MDQPETGLRDIERALKLEPRHPESFKVRLKAYTDQTAPLVPYYERQNKMRGVDGMADIDSVTRAIAGALDA